MSRQMPDRLTRLAPKGSADPDRLIDLDLDRLRARHTIGTRALDSVSPGRSNIAGAHVRRRGHAGDRLYFTLSLFCRAACLVRRLTSVASSSSSAAARSMPTSSVTN
jgi:hypothetical protein